MGSFPVAWLLVFLLLEFRGEKISSTLRLLISDWFKAVLGEMSVSLTDGVALIDRLGLSGGLSEIL